MDQQDEFSADIGGQKLSLKSQSLNTIICIAILVISVLVGYALVGHTADAKESSKEFVSVMREMTQTMREGNCLNAFPPEKREANADLCKRLSR